MAHDAHSAPSGRGRLAIAFSTTVIILGAEVVGAIIAGSLALLVNAAQMLTDAGGLVITLMAATLVSRHTPGSTKGA